MKWNWILVGLVAGTIFNTVSAAAEELPHEEGWYGGLGVSQNANELSADYLNSAAWSVLNPAETSADNQSVGFSVYGGWRFSKHLALDVAYVNFGKTNYHLGSQWEFSPALPPGACGGGGCPPRPIYPPSDYTLDTAVLRAALKGSLPIGERWTLDGHLGLGVEEWKARGASGDRGDANELVAMIGIGGSYAFNQHWRLRLDWDWYVPVDTDSAYDGSIYDDVPNPSHGALYEALEVRSFSLNIEYRL